MLRRRLGVFLVLATSAAAKGAAFVSLVPTPPANGVSYVPNEQVRVDFFVQLDSNGPATILTRLLQFDLSDSSPELSFLPIVNHPQSATGPIQFWNFDGSTGCVSDPTSCGFNYFIDGDPAPWTLLDGSKTQDDILVVAYFGLTANATRQIQLSQASPTLVGSLGVVMPATGGDFFVDALNADHSDINFGAALFYGFGTFADPSARLHAIHGQILYNPDVGPLEDGGVAFAVAPEPATLLLLVLGSVCSFRRNLIPA